MSKSCLILASGSAARQSMLRNAGVAFESMPADIEEKKIIEECRSKKMTMNDIVLLLSKEKALEISKDNNQKYIVGSDQILIMNNKIFNKAKNKAEAKERLKNFQGQEHSLMSAVSVAKNNQIVWSACEEAKLTMNQMNDQEIDHYIDKAGDVVTQCVGCYAIEGLGIRLFEKIEGDFFTILGMPLLPLLRYLDDEGVLS